jgi:hypothetical protein
MKQIRFLEPRPKHACDDGSYADSDEKSIHHFSVRSCFDLANIAPLPQMP